MTDIERVPPSAPAVGETSLAGGAHGSGLPDEGLDPPRGPSTERRRRARPKTLSLRQITKAELERGRALYPDTGARKPLRRSECHEFERPCPFVSCRYHLYIDVHPERGAIKLNFPELEVWEMTETCALDVADRGGVTLEEVGALMSLTRERVRQLESAGLRSVGASPVVASLAVADGG